MGTRTRNRGLLATAVIALLGAAACGNAAAGADSGTVRVVASTDVWGNIASVVGGRHAQVTSIITDPSADPHEYEASARTRLEVSRAAVVIENGGGYDDFMHQLVSAGGTKATVIDAVDVSGLAARSGGDLNEHVWYDFPTTSASPTSTGSTSRSSSPPPSSAAGPAADRCEGPGSLPGTIPTCVR